MKRIILALDGIADEPMDALDGKTPLEVAKKPGLNALVRDGALGRLQIGDGRQRPSEAAEISCYLGSPFGTVPARGSLTTEAIELKAAGEEWLLSCRLVTVLEGKLLDARGGGIGERESAALFEALNRAFKDRNIRFYSGEPRCHLMSIRGDEHMARMGELELSDPDDSVGADQYGSWSRAAAGGRLKLILSEVSDILEGHEVNKVRVDLNENPANAIWVWGAGHPLARKAFAGTGKAVVLSSSDAWKGAAALTGMDWAPSLPSTAADPSELGELSARFFGWLDSHDWVYLHLTQMDRFALTGDYKKKIRWIEAVDQHLLSPLRERLAAGDRVAVTSGHVTSTARRERTSAEAPFVICGAGTAAAGATEFTEEASTRAGKPCSANDFFKKLN